MSTPQANDTAKRMQDIGHAVNERIPEGYGFFVMVFPFNGPADGRANFISNGQRQGVLNMMKEFLIRNGAQEDWMKDL